MYFFTYVFIPFTCGLYMLSVEKFIWLCSNVFDVAELWCM